MQVSIHKTTGKLSALLITAGIMLSGAVQAGENSSFDVSLLNKNISPCSDFDGYANNIWKEKNPIPSTDSRWGTFDILNEENEKKIDAIFADLLKTTNAQKGSNEQLIGDLYRSFLDQKTKDARGTEPLKPYFAMIDRVVNLTDLVRVAAILPGVDFPFNIYIAPDLKNSNVNQLYINQSGLSLYDKEYYLSNSEDFKKIREAYLTHLINMHKLLGMKQGEATLMAKNVMNIETAIAKLHIDKEDRRDPIATYNKVSLGQLKSLSPNVNWDAYFQGLNINPQEMVIENIVYIQQVSPLLDQFTLEQWKAYAKWNLVTHFAKVLPTAFDVENFRFKGTVLNGILEQKPLEKRALKMVNAYLGEPVGKVFVDRHFSAASKKKVESMIENLRAAYIDRVKQLDWMSDATKAKAIEKLKSFTYKIGYPEVWKDYSMLDIRADRAFENAVKLEQYEAKKLLEKLGKPVDKKEWEMSPQEVNAYYNPMGNEVVFPAGILQAPFFNPDADDAINYGAIGAVIGHEFTHGFDDQGSMFDGEGNMNDWWTAEDKAKFKERTQMLQDQYSNFEILPGVKVNGEYTLGENIADQGGVLLAYYALLKSYEGKPRPAPIDGFTFQQRFFLGWAQAWRENATDETIKQLITIDSHSPARARVNATLANLKEFQEAFGCNGETFLNVAKRVMVW
jgi:putative endopeptidase